MAKAPKHFAIEGKPNGSHPYRSPYLPVWGPQNATETTWIHARTNPPTQAWKLLAPRQGDLLKPGHVWTSRDAELPIDLIRMCAFWRFPLLSLNPRVQPTNKQHLGPSEHGRQLSHLAQSWAESWELSRPQFICCKSRGKGANWRVGLWGTWASWHSR